MNKRDFLKLSSAAIAASLIHLPVKGSSLKAGKSFLDKQPITRTLGKTGIKLPIVGSGIIPVDNPALLRAIFKSEIKYIDSAWEYLNGRVDIVLGRMLTEFGRENFIISTKILFDTDKETGQYKKDATTQVFLKRLDESLKRQNTDYVDILYLHAPPSKAAALNEEMLNGLRKAKEQGKARFIGLSTHSNQTELIDAALESKLYDVVLTGYNFKQDNIVKSAIAKASAAGLGVIAMKVFAGNYEDTNLAKPINKKAALKWVLNDENIHTTIITIKNFEDLELCKQMMTDIEMNDQEVKDLQASYQTPGLYCLGCEACKPQCPQKLPITDLMRAYMYTYGYKDVSKARVLLDRLSINEKPCENCSTCVVKCTKGFDVADRINDISRLKNIPAEFLA
ncbi:hypothetical protein ES708_18561 [subsurface metagenome]